jgi:hypothetical protein
MTPKEAAAWMRMDSQEQRDHITSTLTAPSVSQVDHQMWAMRNKALRILIEHAENT